MSDSTKNILWAIAATALLAIAQKISGADDNDALVYLVLYMAIRARLDQATAAIAAKP